MEIEMRERGKKKKRNFKNQAGLTLCELIIVLGIIISLIAIASPNIGRLSSGYRLRGAAREVATDLHFNAQSYQVVRVSDGFVAKTRNFNSDYPETQITGSSVNFNSRGNSSTHTITVSNSTGSKTISVVPTGRVKLQ